MSRVILAFCWLLIHLTAVAQTSKQYEFKFNQPQTLNPALDAAGGQPVIITDYTFCSDDGRVKVSFLPSSIGTGVYLYPQLIDGVVVNSYLYISPRAQMIVTTEDSDIESLVFSADTYTGDLYLLNPSNVGHTTPFMDWYSDGVNGVKELKFIQQNHVGNIYSFTVSYSVPKEKIYPVLESIEDGATIPSFNSLVLSFNKVMTVKNAAAVTMTYSGGTENMIVTSQGTDVILSSLNEIKEDDSITISVPTGSLISEDGYEVADLSYSFKVQVDKAVLAYSSITPSVTETYEQLPSPIAIMYPTPVKLDTTKVYAEVYCGDSFEGKLDMSISDSIPEAVMLYSNSLLEKEGTYNVVVPEGAIHTIAYKTDTESKDDRWNPEFSIKFTVVKSTTPSDPDNPNPDNPDPEVPKDSEIMKIAKSLLELNGIGFPTDTCYSRVNLLQLTTQEEMPSDSALYVGVEAFYNETDVIMPQSDKWYNIAGVNSKGERIYITLEDNRTRAGISKEENNAAPFQVVAVDSNKVVFQTEDGLYLHVLSTLRNYDKTSERNLTDAKSEVNELDFSKMLAKDCSDSVDAKSLLGMFTMKGSLGKHVSGQSPEVNALLDYTGDGEIYTDIGMPLYFNENKSSAFVILEASTPPNLIINPTFYSEPNVLESDSLPLVLTIHVPSVKLNEKENAAKPYFVNLLTDTIVEGTASEIITPIEDTKNKFHVHVNGLGNGTYQIIMPQGTFDYSDNKKEVIDVQFVVTFIISMPNVNPEDPNPDDPNPDDPNPDDPTPYTPEPTDEFNRNYYAISWLESIQRYEQGRNVIGATDLNDFVLFAQVGSPFTGLVADQTKEVRLTKSSNGKLVRVGHFVPYPEIGSILGDNDYQAIKLVLDEPLHEGELINKEGTYCYNILSDTYGDINFGKYLENPGSISRSDCIVNEAKVFTVYVDDLVITGIRQMNIGEDNDVVFDLSGRRQTGKLKPGLYIVNGKKKVVR